MVGEPSELVRYIEQCSSDSERWFPGTRDDLPFMVLALAGEVGELANIVKKIERGTLSKKDAAVRRELAMEATDVFIYLMNVFKLLGVDPGKAYEQKRSINERRFGNGKR
jgi:NTP pyrophosphatase (non-canonical NTP hydrolase)